MNSPALLLPALPLGLLLDRLLAQPAALRIALAAVAADRQGLGAALAEWSRP